MKNSITVFLPQGIAEENIKELCESPIVNEVIVLTDKEKRESKRNMESRYKSWGIELKLDKLTFLIL